MTTKAQRKKASKRFVVTFALMGVAIITSVAIISFGGAGLTNQPISLAQSSFTPVQIRKVSYLVYDAADPSKLLGNITKSTNPTTPGQFRDPTFKYPKVDVFTSQPFVTDAAGNYLTTSQQSNLVQDRVVINGRAYFITEYYMGIDIGCRTYANFDPNRVQYTNVLSPLDGITFNRPPCYMYPGMDLGTKTWTLASDPLLKGRLLMSVDVGSSGWADSPSPQTDYGAGYAEITSSLERIDFVVGNQGSSAATAYTFNAAMTRLRTNYGNGKVTVTPVITLETLSNYLVYSYDQVQEVDDDDVTIEVKTSSAQIGFLTAFDANIDQTGVIPNAFDARFKIASQMPTTNKQETEPRSKPKDEDRVQDDGETIEITTTGYISNFIDITADGQTITGDATPYPGTAPFLTETEKIQIDLSDPTTFTLPQQMLLRTDFDLQPATTINIVQADVKCAAAFWDNQGACTIQGDDTLEPNIDTISWPYALKIENVYAMKRIVFKIACLTDNEISVIRADGTPYDVSKISDFALNSILNNPRNDELFVKQITNFQDTNEIWRNIMTGVWTWVIIVLVVVALISFFALRAYFRGGGGGGGGAMAIVGKFLGGGGGGTTGSGGGYVGGGQPQQPQPSQPQP